VDTKTCLQHSGPW